MTTLFTVEDESCKNFEAIFLKTLFFKSSTLNAYTCESFALKKLGEISIDPKFYLVLRSSHNSIPQKCDLSRCTYTYVGSQNQLHKIIKKLLHSKKVDMVCVIMEKHDMRYHGKT